MEVRRCVTKLALAWLLASGAAAHAAPISYAGHLGLGGSAIGSVDADTGPWTDGSGWQFWTFNANLFDQVTITVERLSADLDPVFGVWFGQEADTSAYFDMSSDSLASTWIGMGDDELPAFTVGGLGGDGKLEFTSYTSGTFVIAVADHLLTPGGLSDMPYRVTVAVPEPETYAQLVAGMLLLGGLSIARRNRKD